MQTSVAAFGVKSNVDGDMSTFEQLPCQGKEAVNLWEQTKEVLEQLQAGCSSSSSSNASTAHSGRLIRAPRLMQQDLFEFRTRIQRWKETSAEM